jgi:hypothetical protein
MMGRRRGRRALAGMVLAVSLTGTLLGVSVASADCGGVQTAKPKHKRVAPRSPLAIGDSSMLLALPRLAHVGYRVNARGCRQFSEGLQVLRDARRSDRLPRLVVIALGADASISSGQVRAAIKIMGPKRKLGLVTPRELGGGESNDARVVRHSGDRYPIRVKVLDWVRYSAGHGSWFQPDGLHLTFPGANAFARLLAKLIPIAGHKPGSGKGRKKGKQSEI